MDIQVLKNIAIDGTVLLKGTVIQIEENKAISLIKAGQATLSSKSVNDVEILRASGYDI